MKPDWIYLSIAATAVLYLVFAFIVFRHSWLTRSQVHYLAKKGKRVKGKIISLAHNKFVEVEFTNLSGSRVITDFYFSKSVVDKMTQGSEVDVLLESDPNKAPTIGVEYKGTPMMPVTTKFNRIALLLLFITILLGAVLVVSQGSSVPASYSGGLIALIAALFIFIAIMEDEKIQVRTKNSLLLFGHNATAHIRKANTTGIVKRGCQQISFFLEFQDKEGKNHFGKAEELLEVKDYQYFKKEKRVGILYLVDTKRKRCLLNYTWQ